MRWALLATLLAGCGMGFDDETPPSPETPEECLKAGGKVAERDGAKFCDLPASGGYVASKLASAQAGDAGPHD